MKRLLIYWELEFLLNTARTPISRGVPPPLSMEFIVVLMERIIVLTDGTYYCLNRIKTKNCLAEENWQRRTVYNCALNQSQCIPIVQPKGQSDVRALSSDQWAWGALFNGLINNGPGLQSILLPKYVPKYVPKLGTQIGYPTFWPHLPATVVSASTKVWLY